jgi:predicted PurR-regulated permease PerM
VTNKRVIFWAGIALLLFVFIFLIRSILLPFVLGIFIAYFLSPAADKLQKLRIPRSLATLIVLGTFFTSITLLLLLVVPILVNQLSGLVAALPGYIHDIQVKYLPLMQSWLGENLSSAEELQSNLQTTLSDHSDAVLKFAAGFLTGIFQSGMTIINFFSLILITPVVAFYLLYDWHRIISRVDALLPRQHIHVIRQQIRIIDNTLAGFLRGQLNVCLILGCFYAIGLSLVGLKFAIIIGLATGLLVIIPYLGLFFGMSIGLGAAFFQFGDMHKLLLVLAVFITGQVIEGNFVTPKLVGEKVGLHPVWIIFGMLSGAALFGFVGVLIAVPVSAVLGVLIRFAIQEYLQSGYYKGENPPLIKP